MFIQIEDYWNTLKSKRINPDNIAWYEPVDDASKTFEYTIHIRFRNQLYDNYKEEHDFDLVYKSKTKRDKVIKFLDETLNLRTQNDLIQL